MVHNFYCNKKKSVILITILFLLVSSSFIFAQTGTVSGTVADKNTNEILPGANVLVKGTSLGAATDLSGKFVIKNVPAGNQTLIISYIGYESITVNVDVPENKTLEENYFLNYKSIEGETVTITAQAEGQLGAINQQLNTNNIANVVSKDRIKELPDVNAAETIGRLPGVSIQRSGGEASKIEIRGLSPKYNLITVNGVELPATGTEDRSVDLALISSNMLDGIILKKSNTPDMDADVLGGTVDLKLKEAPEGLNFNLSAQGGHSALQRSYDNYSLTASLSDRFFDSRLGLIVNTNIDNYDRSSDKLQDDWRNYNETIATGQLILREQQLNRKRIGASILGDFIIPDGKINANVFFNQLSSDGLVHFNQVNTLENGYSTNRHIYQTEQYNDSTTNIWTGTIGINQNFSWISYNASLSRSGTATNDPDRRVYEFTQEQSSLLPGYPIYVQPSVLAKYYNVDTIHTNMSSLFSYGTRTIENITSAKLDFEIPYKLSDQLSGYIKTGAKLRWIDRINDQTQHGYGGLQYGSGETNPVFKYINEVYPDWGIKADVDEYKLLTILPFISYYNRSDFLNGDYQLGLIANEERLHQMTDALISAPDSLTLWLPYSTGSFGYDYKGFERYEAAYLMGELNWGTFLTLIPGVRWEQEYTVYDGQRFVPNQAAFRETPPSDFVRLNKVRKNKFWLPMVTLLLKPTDWLQVRLAGTQTLARPDFLRYAPISYINIYRDQITAANYSLRPSLSTNYDISVSVFNNEIGLFSVNAFYKNIKDLIFYSAFPWYAGIDVDPSLEIPNSWLNPVKHPRINAFRNNPDPAKYSGFEIEWQTHFWYLPSVLSGLVLNINYTHIYSEMKLAYDSLVTIQQGLERIRYLLPTSIKTRMPDQPKNIFNVTIGYDVGGFSARLSYLYQTDKLTGIGYDGAIPTSRLSTYTGGYGRWDLAVQQKLEGTNFQLFANFNNLNNRHDESFLGSDLLKPSYIEYYGFTMDLGVRYNL